MCKKIESKNRLKSDKLTEQSKYHSFIVCQTKILQISQKFPYHVTTLNGQFVQPNNNNKQLENILYEYNFTIDCINYIFNGKYLILAQGEWIKNIISNQQKKKLESQQKINYIQISLKEHIKFYFYCIKTQQFIELLPHYILKLDCIIFQDIQHINQLQFIHINQNSIRQIINSLKKDSSNQHQKEIFTFKCQYAIMSDNHFLGNFVFGYKPICSYLKINQIDQYQRFMDQKILKFLEKKYPKPNL